LGHEPEDECALLLRRGCAIRAEDGSEARRERA
jgi:hypothetical protein